MCVRWAADKQIHLISDEIYANSVFPGENFISVCVSARECVCIHMRTCVYPTPSFPARASPRCVRVRVRELGTHARTCVPNSVFPGQNLTSACMYLCVCVCVCLCVYLYTYVWVWVCVRVYIYMYVHTHTHTHTDCARVQRLMGQQTRGPLHG
jgi:hypothetical protein